MSNGSGPMSGFSCSPTIRRVTFSLGKYVRLNLIVKTCLFYSESPRNCLLLCFHFNADLISCIACVVLLSHDWYVDSSATHICANVLLHGIISGTSNASLLTFLHDANPDISTVEK